MMWRGYQTGCAEARVGKGSVKVQSFPYRVFHALILKTKYMVTSLHQMWVKGWRQMGTDV